jgi:hypothetical protein
VRQYDKRGVEIFQRKKKKNKTRTGAKLEIVAAFMGRGMVALNQLVKEQLRRGDWKSGSRGKDRSEQSPAN